MHKRLTLHVGLARTATVNKKNGNFCLIQENGSSNNECVTNISDSDCHLLTKDNLIAGQPEFLLSGNPLICDCDLEWLPGINSEEMQEHHPRVSDLSDIKCRLNNQR